MRTALGWVVLFVLVLFQVLEGCVLSIAQTGHDFNSGGPNPPELQYAWLFFYLKVAALAVSLRSALPLLIVAVINLICGVILQMHTLHRPFIDALVDGWMFTSFLLLAVIYVATVGWRSRRINLSYAGRLRRWLKRVSG